MTINIIKNILNVETKIISKTTITALALSILRLDVYEKWVKIQMIMEKNIICLMFFLCVFVSS